jgi:hypothetical protein
MSKQASIPSLVRAAARSENEFVSTVEDVFVEAEVERIWEFFDRLNIPRSTMAGDTDLQAPLRNLQTEHSMRVWTFEDERTISSGIQRFLDRHERKIKWHAGHPSAEGIEKVLLDLRHGMATTNLRLLRLQVLLRTKDELTPQEWQICRELMNRTFLSFRNYLNHAAGDWIDAMQNAVSREDLSTALGSFYELIDNEIRLLEEFRHKIEERRLELTVLPEGYPPVRPPNYFGGDLMGRGPWKQFWAVVNSRAHHFRESVVY